MSIEAMLSLLAFFSLLGLFLSIAQEQNQKTAESALQFKAIAEAQKCAVIIDSVFANPGALPEEIETNCFQKEENSVSSTTEGKEAKATVLAKNVFSSKTSAATAIEVKANAHYK